MNCHSLYRPMMFLLCGVVFLLGAVFGEAKEFRLPEKSPHLKVTLPSEWKLTPTAHGVDAVSQDGHVYLSIHAVAKGEMEKQLNKGIRYLEEHGVILDKATLKQERANLNGVLMREASWKAKNKEGRLFVASVSMLEIGGEKGATIVYWATTAGEKANQAALASILLSVTGIN